MSEHENEHTNEQTTKTAAATIAERTIEEAEQPPGAETTPSRRRLERTTLILLGGLAVAIVTAVVLGVAVANANRELAASEAETAELSAQVADLETDLEDVTASRDQYRDDASRVAEREIEVSKREDEVTAREEAITAEEERVAATTLLDGFAYTVGQTMEAGTYEANATGGTCYWEITTTGSNYSDIVDNDLGTRGVIRVTVSAGQDFSSQRCGDWRKVG
ncbi:hypothetical protein [Agromyces bracchium]|uniref:Uncharacterized protein n=1 Tax=Agromyces bracchium TaxID=88376 RepID=A0A6I3M967_9MICO|nr:hypothetical protein [Agromyces bracchium]MTH68662.1 hypothetical protein [Agromyces bracchium]